MLITPFTGGQRRALPKADSTLGKNTITIIGSVLAILLIGRVSFAVQGRIAARVLNEISQGNASSSDLEKAARLLPVAANSGVVLPRDGLNAAYRRLAGANAPGAWKASLAIVSYQSVFIASPLPLKHAPFRQIDREFKFNLALASTPPGLKAGGRLPGNLLHTYGDDVPIENAARLEPIGSDANSGRRFGPQIIVIDVGDIGLRLDDMWMRKVVVMHSRVVYSNAPVRLDQVYFIDCQFQMENGSSARRISEEVLAGLPVSLEPTTGLREVALRKTSRQN